MTDPTPSTPRNPQTLSPRVQPYGTWPSPVSAADLAASAIGYADVVADGETVYWLQSRASKGGRAAVMRHAGSGPAEQISPEAFNARTRVGEYGGGALGAGHGVVLACSWSDQRVHRITESTTVPVTPEPSSPAGIRWSGMTVVPGAQAFVAVRETHGDDRPRANVNVHGTDEAVNEIVAVDLQTGDQTVLVTGPDFVGGPWLSPGGTRIAWLQWDHPHMPWETAELWAADLQQDDGVPALARPRAIAGGRRDGTTSAVSDAVWTDDSTLLFCDDPSGWWNVHRWDGDRVIRVQDESVDSGRPRWVNSPGVLTALGDHIVVGTVVKGLMHLRMIEGEGRGRDLDIEGVRWIPDVTSTPTRLIMIAGGPLLSSGVWAVDPATGDATRVSEPEESPTALSVPEPISFPTTGGAIAHALYYPPASLTHVGPPDERAPLVVLSHGGPTAAARASVNPTAQYWTSRGLAVVDVNYRGSTGYGRAYRESLTGRWGQHDVDDCIAATAFLVARGDADPTRLVIEGGSAGGYTTLLALCTTDTFAAGGSSYGVADLRALATDTHKFESRYLDSMIGPWPADEQVYIDRSPITHVDRLRTPMIVLQGDEDAVVPPAQAELIVTALRERRIPHAYLLFEGEQHGFRKAENITRSVEARLAFYGMMLGFTPDDDITLDEFVPG